MCLYVTVLRTCGFDCVYNYNIVCAKLNMKDKMKQKNCIQIKNVKKEIYIKVSNEFVW